ncbi:MAG: hypothetical protein ACW98F_16310 [Candidatus Hodarchaeales archaeon]
MKKLSGFLIKPWEFRFDKIEESCILGKIITQGLIKAGRYHELEVLVEDKPGKLEALLEIITSVEGNVVDIDFDRYSHTIPFGYVGLHIALETKNHLHSKEITEKVEASYQVNR